MTGEAIGQQQICPISHQVDIRTIPNAGIQVVLAADEDQRRALAEAHGLQRVLSFDADLLLKAWRRDGVRLTGTVEAVVVQQCVVTLEPIETKVAETIELLMVAEENNRSFGPESATEIVVNADGPDEPDTFSGGNLDVGAIAEEFFALALDPYPRSEGVEFETGPSGETIEETPSPFAKLASLKNHE